MSPGQADPAVVRRHLLALDERGLELCAQNALDIATHLAASTGRDGWNPPRWRSAVTAVVDAV